MERYLELDREAIATFADVAVFELRACINERHSQIVCDPQHGIAYRIKSDASIRRKLERLRAQSILHPLISDIVGVRVLCACSGQMGATLEAVKDWEVRMGLTRSALKDQLSGDESGYSAVHIDYQLQSNNRYLLSEYVTIEVQVTTWLRYLHAMASHALWYKKESDCRAAVTSELQLLAEQITEVEKQVCKLFHTM